MLRPLGDYILVQMDPPPKSAGLVITVHGPRVRTGEVRAVGPGRATKRGRRPVGLERGERVAFFREHLEHLQGKAVTRSLAELEDGLALLRVDDVLFVVLPGWAGELS